MEIKQKIQAKWHSIDMEKIRTDCCRSARLWCWRSGLGRALNCRPLLFGQQLAVVFSDKTTCEPLYCVNFEGKTLAIVPPSEKQNCKEGLLNSSAIEIWMKSGWFSGNASFINEEEKENLCSSLKAEHIFGKSALLIRYPDLVSCDFLNITRSAACTGEKGPGQYSWVWAASSLFFFFAWLGAKNKKPGKKTSGKQL